MNVYRKFRKKNASKGLNISPIDNLFVSQTLPLPCEYCGFTEAQIGHKLKVCGRCKIAVYCSKSCQEKAWKTHKQMCHSYIKVDKAYKDKKKSN